MDAAQAGQAGSAGAALPSFELEVSAVQVINPLIRAFHLRRPDGADLPGFEAGAHVKVAVRLPDGRSDWRQYSLINFSIDPAATRSPQAYCIAVREESSGRGGSAFMHRQVKVGDRLQVQAPDNDFALQAHPGTVVLLAGGIGVTPLISMAATALAQARPVRMAYAGRSLGLLAYREPLQALLGDRLHCHGDAEAGRLFDVAGFLATCQAQDHLYVCGPQAMLDQVLACARSAGWNESRIHFELFSAPAVQEGDHAFELVLLQSGKTLTVPPDKSILDCMLEAGLDPMFDCKRGECGVCAAPVFEGEPDHRDYVLSAAEKKANQVIQTCVSRCKGTRLVLDI